MDPRGETENPAPCRLQSKMGNLSPPLPHVLENYQGPLLHILVYMKTNIINSSLMLLLLGLCHIWLPGHHRESSWWENFCTASYELDASLISNNEPTTSFRLLLKASFWMQTHLIQVPPWEIDDITIMDMIPIRHLHFVAK